MPNMPSLKGEAVKKRGTRTRPGKVVKGNFIVKAGYHRLKKHRGGRSKRKYCEKTLIPKGWVPGEKIPCKSGEGGKPSGRSYWAAKNQISKMSFARGGGAIGEEFRGGKALSTRQGVGG